MNKNFLLGLLAVLALNCKNETSRISETEGTPIENDSVKTAKQSDGLILFTGKFIYYADAAVLQANDNTMYGVVIDEKMHELNKRVNEYKTEDTDFVPVAIRGVRIPKPQGEEGWPYKIEIKEIVNVYKPNPEDNEVIKF